MGTIYYPMEGGQPSYQPDVNERSLTPFRVHEEETPALTVYVDSGSANIRGRHYEWSGGSSDAFVPPTTDGFSRIDTLYMDLDGLHIVTGTEMATPYIDYATPPVAPDGMLTLAQITLDYGQTTIVEADIFYDAREFLSVAQNVIESWTYANAAARTGATGFVANDVGRVSYQSDTGTYWRLTAITPTWAPIPPYNALLDGVVHSDTLADAVTAGDIIIGNDTPKWSSLALTVPIANTRNTLGVSNGDTKPSWQPLIAVTSVEPVTTVAGLLWVDTT